MQVGKKIKQLRELRNFTKNDLADALNMSLSGYSKIERDETDISLQRLSKIAEILETDVSAILNFDSKQVFNQLNNKTANGIVHHQHITGDNNLEDFFVKLKSEIETLRNDVQELKTNNK
jgi:transcriptional regulator with XRE-family HTH domain